MKRIGILGHFGFGTEKSNGQTIKTKTVTEALQKVYGLQAIGMEDTMGGWKFMFLLPKVVWHLLRNYQNIIIMPAYRGVHFISPLLVAGNVFFRRRLHYVVIGGWLPDYVKKYPLLRFVLHRFHKIYVETCHMQRQMEEYGYANITVMPNFKSLDIIDKDALPTHNQYPLRLCTFSRVMKEKGIEDAILAVDKCNQFFKKDIFTLDIYGQVESDQTDWFEQLRSTMPSTVKYGGIIPYTDSTQILHEYFALLFPTHFKTEGFAGTIVDAMAAGVPPIASDCPSNCELIKDGTTGMLFPLGSTEALTQLLISIAQAPSTIDGMRVHCLQEAQKYTPEKVIMTLCQQIK